MFDMLNGASSFNADLNKWKPEKVTNFKQTFAYTPNFTTPLTLNVPAAQDVSYMFAYSGNPTVKLYQTAEVTTMLGLFRNSEIQEAIVENTSKVTNMQDVFYRAPKYT